MATSSSLIVVLLCFCFFSQTVHAFGAGSVPETSEFAGYLWRHGDVAVAVLPYLFYGNDDNRKAYGHSYREIMPDKVYRGNWLRDYSQLIDVLVLEKKVPEELLHAFVQILAYMQFGDLYPKITREVLGVYSHVEHIDNPRGYSENAHNIDHRLRRPWTWPEIDFNRQNGMKNYIAGNPDVKWDNGTPFQNSADYLRSKLMDAVHWGREGRLDEAMLALGAALHTLEDFPAHSNFVELCLWVLHERDIFTYVGPLSRINIKEYPSGQTVAWPPLVTGMFGSNDIFVSLLGEADDKAALEHHVHQHDFEKFTKV